MTQPLARLATPSDASQRLRSLAALSGSLTDALGPEEAASLVERQGLAALAACCAAVVTLGVFPPPIDGPAPPADTLEVVQAVGMPPASLAQLHGIPLAGEVPYAEVARTGEPVFLESPAALRRYPAWGEVTVADGIAAVAVVPVWANGELRGVLGLGWPEPRAFDADERAFVITLGVMCAQAIMRAHLRAAEREARRAAEFANASRARFIATVSHELRTPMNAVLGYAALVSAGIDGPVSALQKHHLGRIDSSGRHLLLLIGDLLEHARIEAGHVAVHRDTVAVAKLLGEAFVLVGPEARQKGLHLRVHAVDERLTMYTDARKVVQVLVNLLANAIKFTSAGSILVHATVVPGEDGDTVRFDVADTGRGIAAADREHVFDPYWRAEDGTKSSAAGTGLGLAVSRELARLLGGDVVVGDSVEDVGSTFVFTVPRGQAA